MAVMPPVQSEAKKTVDLWVDIGSDSTAIAVARERLGAESRGNRDAGRPHPIP
jgi:hypothetical protein